MLKFLTIASMSLILTTADLQARAKNPVVSPQSSGIHLAQVNKGVIAKKFNHAAKAPRAQFNRAAGNAARTNAARTNAARTNAARTTTATKSRVASSRTALTARVASTSARLRATQTQQAKIPAKMGLSRTFGKAAVNPTLAGRLSATSARLNSRRITSAKIPQRPPLSVSRANIASSSLRSTIKGAKISQGSLKKLNQGAQSISGLLGKSKSGGKNGGYSKLQLNLTPPGPISR